MSKKTRYQIWVDGYFRDIDEHIYKDLTSNNPSERSMVWLSATVQEIIKQHLTARPKYEVKFLTSVITTTTDKTLTMEPTFYKEIS